MLRFWHVFEPVWSALQRLVLHGGIEIAGEVGDLRHEQRAADAGLGKTALQFGLHARFGIGDTLIGLAELLTLQDADAGCITKRANEMLSLVGLDPAKFGTHSLRRTKAVLIYRRTGNLRAVQLLLGHSKIESTVRYLGIEVDDAIEIAGKIDI